MMPVANSSLLFFVTFLLGTLNASADPGKADCSSLREQMSTLPSKNNYIEECNQCQTDATGIYIPSPHGLNDTACVCQTSSANSNASINPYSSSCSGGGVVPTTAHISIVNPKPSVVPDSPSSVPDITCTYTNGSPMMLKFNHTNGTADQTTYCYGQTNCTIPDNALNSDMKKRTYENHQVQTPDLPGNSVLCSYATGGGCKSATDCTLSDWAGIPLDKVRAIADMVKSNKTSPASGGSTGSSSGQTTSGQAE
jgi:hypothetical protein